MRRPIDRAAFGAGVRGPRAIGNRARGPLLADALFCHLLSSKHLQLCQRRYSGDEEQRSPSCRDPGLPRAACHARPTTRQPSSDHAARVAGEQLAEGRVDAHPAGGQAAVAASRGRVRSTSAPLSSGAAPVIAGPAGGRAPHGRRKAAQLASFGVWVGTAAPVLTGTRRQRPAADQSEPCPVCCAGWR
jgi:hypothetical protein